MKKRVFVVTLLAICITASIVPAITKAVVTPYFVAVNDTLLPFSDDTMPNIIGGEYYLPSSVFSEVRLSSFNPVNTNTLMMFTGVGTETRIVYFRVDRGVTEDQDGNILDWPTARKSGNKFYVPLRQVCGYFGINYEIIEIPPEVIPNEQLYIIRVLRTSDAFFNSNTFLGYNSQALRRAYSAYYSPPTPTDTIQLPGVTDTDMPPVSPTAEPSPTYSDVIIYLSYYKLSAGNVERILQLADAVQGYPACFFINIPDIMENPALIRKIHGSGAAIGIWLEKGTFEEYLEASELLFEAAKIKTVLVSAGRTLESIDDFEDGDGLALGDMIDLESDNDGFNEGNDRAETADNKPATVVDDTIAQESVPQESIADRAANMAKQHSLLFWDTEYSYGEYDEANIDMIIEALPTVSGVRENIRFSCSEATVLMLPDLFLWLNEYEYTIGKITETVAVP